MKKEISQKFSLLSFIMTCIIVFYHMKITPEYYINNIDMNLYNFSNNIFDCLGNIAMGYFFMTTGFFMYRNLNSSNVYEKIKKRISTLLVPYIIWNILYFIFKSILGQTFSIQEIILKLLFDPFDGPLWYILAIFALALLSPIFLKIFKNKKYSIVILMTIYVISFVLTTFKQNDLINLTTYGWYFERLLRYLPNYFTGVIVAIHFNHLLEFKKRKTIYISILLFILTLLLIGGNIINYNIMWIINKIQPLLIWYILMPKIYNSKKMVLLFNSSFIIYAMHAVLIDIIYALMKRIPYISNLLSGIGSIGIRLCLTICVILISIITSYILKKLFPKYIHLLTGGR